MAWINKREYTNMRGLPETISIEELVILIKNTKSPHHKLAFKLGFLCGLRVSEVVKLKLEHIDLNRGFLFIKDSKWGRDRYVPIPAPLKKDLRKFNSFKKVGVRALQKMYRKQCLRYLKRDLNFHTLRHSCATNYLHKGMNVKQVQMLLGHSSLTTTAIYLHVKPSELKTKIDEIWT